MYMQQVGARIQEHQYYHWFTRTRTITETQIYTLLLIRLSMCIRDRSRDHRVADQEQRTGDRHEHTHKRHSAHRRALLAAPI